MEISVELEKVKKRALRGCGRLFQLLAAIWICAHNPGPMVLKNGKIYVQAGAGIVYDSIPESEHQESLNKSRGMLQAYVWRQAGFEN